LNHLRFYLPHVSIFRQKRYFYFLDDDILVKKDLGVLAERTMNDLQASRGLVCPCNIWMVRSDPLLSFLDGTDPVHFSLANDNSGTRTAFTLNFKARRTTF
jgi:hypothetical protein